MTEKYDRSCMNITLYEFKPSNSEVNISLNICHEKGLNRESIRLSHSITQKEELI